MTVRQYNTDIGYITIPEAAERVIDELKIPHTQENWNKEYRRILKLVNKGQLNAKKHGKRINQVEVQEIDDYIEERLKDPEQMEIDFKGLEQAAQDAAALKHIQELISLMKTGILSEDECLMKIQKLLC